MKQIKFGVTEHGEDAAKITLENKNGMTVELTDLGAAIVSLNVPDKNGKKVSVVLGYRTAEEYEHNKNDFGAVIGRSGNRIAGGHFVLNGKEYQLAVTGHNQNLHSGPDKFEFRKWNFETDKGPDGESVTFFLFSPDGDQGYPGNMDVEVTYLLTQDNELRIEYYGMSDADTIMNMTNHAYFNLNGEGSGDIYGHTVQILADRYTLTDDDLIPTGELPEVAGTPMDFRTPKTIGQDFNADFNPLKQGNGYDHNFVVNSGKVQEESLLVASCTGDKSGIKMEVYTDLPGMQMYTANFLNTEGRCGHYGKNSAVCFETQYIPDAINHPDFAQPILKKNQEKLSLTVYRFLTEA